MGKLFFLTFLVAAAFASIAKPWIGVVVSYLFALLTPQAIWYWNFEGLRPVFWVTIPTLLGFVIAAMRGKYSSATLLNARSGWVLVLWLCYVMSYVFGGYVDTVSEYRFTDPAWAMDLVNKMLLLYFLAAVCIDSEKKLRVLVYMFAGSAVYLIYWANNMYLAGWVVGRMAGPVDQYGVGTYADENMFALLFVVAQPFLWYLGHDATSKWTRWCFWLAIPFGWHAVFLTASRGGLVGLLVVTLLMTLRTKRRFLALLLIPAFLIAYEWQAGDLMKSRADSIEEYQTEDAASGRLKAWEAALRMIRDNPAIGVGLGSFGPAFPHYSNERPREAHNTFLHIAAESGLVAGAVYLLLMVSTLTGLWRNGKRLRRDPALGPRSFLYQVNEAVFTAWAGFTTCALFLSLQLFEIGYFLLLVSSVVLFLSETSRVARPVPVKLEGQGVAA